jgi:hypothetical protein
MVMERLADSGLLRALDRNMTAVLGVELVGSALGQKIL